MRALVVALLFAAAFAQSPARAGAPPPASELAGAELLRGRAGADACVTIDRKRAACVAELTETGAVIVLVTRDGGRSWRRVPLGAKAAPNGTIGLVATLGFRGRARGRLVLVDPPQHHNGHRRTTFVYRTKDGGARWTLERVRSRCLEPSTGCRSG